ncbi:MAG: hypothetical protein VB108_00485 [Anaerolineaceae bacterium]|nr:hypothetical protein [Anaerolineaceae bacterium]
MRPIKASELGTFSFCKRAWYYQKNGEPNRNQAAMDEGTCLHGKQARQVAGSLILLVLGLLTLLAALMMWLLNLLK